MKVVAILHGYPPHHNAGAEWMLHTLLRYLVQQGHEVEVTIVSHKRAPREPFSIDGVLVTDVADRRGNYQVVLDDADIVVTHLDATEMAMKAASEQSVPICIVEHNNLAPTKVQLGRWCGPQMVVFNSDWMKADFEATCQAALAGRLRSVIRPAVISSDYVTPRGDEITLVNLYGPKGGPEFWKIAAAMPERRFLGVTGSYGRQAVASPMPPNVSVIPNTPHMRDEVYSRTRILLMPSVYESWGRVGVEAMASGIPVIAHPTPGLAESLSYAGLFCDRGDINQWVSRIRALDDPEIYARYSGLATMRSTELDAIAAKDLATWEQDLVTAAAAFAPRKPRSTPRTA